MRIVFFGCDDFAAVSLQRLIDEGHTLAALVTQPDRPSGRGLQVISGPTKEMGLRHAIEVLQPQDLNASEVISKLKEYAADVFVVVAYGKFLPAAVLGIPKYFCVNVHPSLLPKYRGAAPVNWAVINGDTLTGVTLIRMDPSMDGGDILAQEPYPVPEEMTAAALRDRLAVFGADMLAGLLPRIPSGAFTCVKQDGALATRAPKLSKELGHIHWQDSAKKIHDLVRGTQPWPGAFTYFNGKLLKVLEVGVADVAEACSTAATKPGEILELRKDGFCVQAGDRAVLVKRVHPAGGKAMDARSFCAGHKLSTGDKLG
ncbi:MAG: methionyl-tRNA formyltransferase [Candidatus Omnitrophota bacterium]